jgi:hypothetical protein
VKTLLVITITHFLLMIILFTPTVLLHDSSTLFQYQFERFRNWSQSKKLDSLWSIYKDMKQADTNRLKAVNHLFYDYRYHDESDTAKTLAENEIQLAQQTKNKKYEATGLYNLGTLFDYSESKYYNKIKALDYVLKALKIFDEIGYKRGLTHYFLIGLSNAFETRSHFTPCFFSRN